jgi:hypothetical protein
LVVFITIQPSPLDATAPGQPGDEGGAEGAPRATLAVLPADAPRVALLGGEEDAAALLASLPAQGSDAPVPMVPGLDDLLRQLDLYRPTELPTPGALSLQPDALGGEQQALAAHGPEEPWLLPDLPDSLAAGLPLPDPSGERDLVADPQRCGIPSLIGSIPRDAAPQPVALEERTVSVVGDPSEELLAAAEQPGCSEALFALLALFAGRGLQADPPLSDTNRRARRRVP